MKKFARGFSVIVCALMIFSLFIPAYADGNKKMEIKFTDFKFQTSDNNPEQVYISKWISNHRVVLYF